MKKLLLLFFFSQLAFSQNNILFNGEWNTYSNLKSVYNFLFLNNQVVAATDGGGFIYDKTTQEVTAINNINGLTTINLRAVCVDSKGRIWFGNSNGYIDIFDQKNNSWQHLPDIYLSNVSSKKSINSMYSYGDSIYIATEFGVSVYDVRKNDFQDTYFKFGSLQAFSSISTVKIIAGKIYVLANTAFACAYINNKNLLSPDSWRIYSIPKKLTAESDEITSIESFNNKIYFGTLDGLVRFENDLFYRLNVTYENSPGVKKLYAVNDYLYIAAKYQIFKMPKAESLAYLFNVEDFITDIKVDMNDKIWYSKTDLGLKYFTTSDSTVKEVKLNCPNSNLITGLAVDQNGRLWVGSGNDKNSYGFFSMKNGQWRNFNSVTNPVLSSAGYGKVIVDKSNNVWFGGWGGGIAVVSNDTVVKVWNEKNTNNNLYGANNSYYVVITGLSCDYEGNVWMLNSFSMTGKKLAVFYAKDSTWDSFLNPVIPSVQGHQDIVVDDIGTKWFISGTIALQENQSGIFYYNSKYSVLEAVNGWGLLSSDNIAGAGVILTSLVIDKSSELWIGTSNGVSVVHELKSKVDASHPVSVSRPCYNYTNCNLSGQYVNCIAVDALNNKWIGTKTSGIWILNPSGDQILAQINISNSKILSNDIRAIAINPKDGTVFIGTSNGLSSLKTNLVEPLTQFNKTLKIYPNPFIPGEKSVVIDGLVEGSSLKIITSAGKVIKDLLSPGGKIAFWDGRDNNNNLVASGVYFVIAFNPDGSEVSKGKIGVIRK